MDTPFDKLPNELLDLVIGFSTIRDHATLLLCCQSLQRRLEPLLYQQGANHNRAMTWACRHNVPKTILKASSYGASVVDPWVEVWIRSWSHCMPFPSMELCKLRVLTLYSAAKGSSHDAFKLLLDMGAFLPSRSQLIAQHGRSPTRWEHPVQGQRFLLRLCRPENQNLLVLFFRSQASLPSTEYCPATECLVPLIYRNASTDLIALILDRGADVNTPGKINKYRYLSPLSAAAMNGNIAIFDLLVQRGADVNYRSPSIPTKEPFEIPIFAAVHNMAKTGDTTMVQRCLDLGADINRCWHYIEPRENGAARNQIGRRKWQWQRLSWQHHNTPLTFYLMLLESWTLGQKLPPQDGVTYLLEKGAWIRKPKGHVFNAPEGCIHPTNRPPFAIKLLLVKWGDDMLREPSFLAVVRILAWAERSKERIIDLLLNYNMSISPSLIQLCRGPSPPELWWKEVIDALLHPLNQPQDKDIILTALIIRKAKIWEEKWRSLCLASPTRTATEVAESIRKWTPPSSRTIAPMTMECLLRSGANINAPITGHNDIVATGVNNDSKGGSTVLHELCSLGIGVGGVWLISMQKDFLEQLLRYGADPRITNHEGRTPIDVITDNMTMLNGGHKGYAGMLSDIMKHAAKRLNEVDAATAMTITKNSIL